MKNLKGIALLLALCMIVFTLPMSAFAENVGAADTETVITEETTETTETTETAEATQEPDATTDPEATADVEATTEPEATSAPTATSAPSGQNYTITVDDPDNATLEVSPTRAPEGTEITVDGTAQRGYKFTSLYYTQAEATSSPEATDEPEPTSSPEATTEPEVTTDPEATTEPETTQEPEATTEPETTEEPGATAEAAEISSVELASENVDISGGETLGEDFTVTFDMPAYNIIVSGETDEMTASDVLESANRQNRTVTSRLSTYEDRYASNTDYSSEDRTELRGYISDAEDALEILVERIATLENYLDSGTSTPSAIANARSSVVSAQIEVDAAMEDVENKISDMTGGDGEVFNLYITTNNGISSVSVSGLVSHNSSSTNTTVSDIEPNGEDSLIITFAVTNGYYINRVTVNGANVGSGMFSNNRLTLSPSEVADYSVGGSITVIAYTSSNSYSSGGGTTGGWGGSGTTDNGTTTPTAAPGTTTGFTDLGDVEWAQEAINHLASLGIINGMGDGTFAPNDNVTREQFAKMIVMCMGYTVNDSATSSFSDVVAGEWYAPFVAAAANNNLITGFEDGTFGVGQNITRQDMAVIIYRALGSPNPSSTGSFSDDAEIGDYARLAVYSLVEIGIINGMGDGTFAPQATATRAQAAQMLNGFYNYINQ